jgi:outer membrane scaffolding protein for murein synthesis (MipA/OmpV family)
MRYDLGITGTEAERRQLVVGQGDRRIRSGDALVFSPGGGLQSIGLSFSYVKLLQRPWMFAVVGGVSYLSNAAAGSPLVKSRAQFLLGIGFGYRI